MLRIITWTCIAIVFVLSGGGSAGQTSKVFSMPDAVMLFGNYNELHLVMPEGAQALTPPADVGYNRGYFAFPGLAPDGHAIAWGFATSFDKVRSRPRFTLGLYSVSDKKWRTHGDFDDVGDAAYSADGTGVAIPAGERFRMPLMIFDIATETFRDAGVERGVPPHANLSWAPNGKRLAMRMQRGDSPSVVGVLDLNGGNLRVLGEGFGPRWSPTEDWIAYYADETECVLIRPDGSDRRVVMKLGRRRNFGWGSPVWSPDGSRLLLNVGRGGGPLLDVVMLDVKTGRATTMSSRGLPVFGWAPLRRLAGDR